MKIFLKSISFTALGIAMLSCEKNSSSTAESSMLSEIAAEHQQASTGVGYEPIPSTTPPGSSLDTSSNAYIIFDGSGSMAGTPIDEARRAVQAFVAGAPDDLNIGLFAFDRSHHQGKELVALGRGTEQREELNKAIASIKAGGGTPLGSAINAGTDSLIAQFQKQLRYGDVRLIVVTDGEATDRREFQESIRHARKHHVPIYTIGFKIRNQHPLRQFSESYLTAQDEQELLNAMKETLAELDDDADL